MIKNRPLSFLIVVFVYALATVIGVISYLYLPFNLWINLLLADVIATIVTFIFSVIFKNASVYDPYWSVQPIVIIVAFAIGEKLGLVKILPIAAICIWGVRLTANWAYTFLGLTHQDWRYTMLEEKTGAFYPIINFIGIHLVPTLVVYACVLPAVYVIVVGGKVGILGFLCFALSVIAVVLQGVSDFQMHKFRKSKRGGFIRTGLWKYSRHPNYLGEILMWWGIGLYAVSVLPSMWYLLAGALANTLLFSFVSIPMADGRQSKKAGFGEYKRQTRVLLPIKKFKYKGEKFMLKKTIELYNGVKLPLLGLGTWQTPDAVAEDAVASAIKAGYIHVDTAIVYENEKGVGRGIRKSGIKREDLFITSKVPADRKSYDLAKKSIAESLDSIGVDYLDLMLIHAPRPWPEMHLENAYEYDEENLAVWKALVEAYKEGKLRSIGVSNFGVKHLENIMKNSDVKPMVNQICCYIGNTPKEVIDFCKKNDIVVEAYSPIATGRLLKDERLIGFAKKYGVSIAQLCIRYALQLGLVVLPKSTHEEYIIENAKVDFVISEEDMEVLYNM